MFEAVTYRSIEVETNLNVGLRYYDLWNVKKKHSKQKCLKTNLRSLKKYCINQMFSNIIAVLEVFDDTLKEKDFMHNLVKSREKAVIKS